MSAHQHSGFAAACLLAATCFGTPARAQDSAEIASAKASFDEGRRLAAEGNYDAACAKFEASLLAVNGVGTRFNLAACEERRQRYARAQTLFLEVAEQARQAGQLEREQVARDRAAALESKLSRLTVELQAPAVEFELDGRPLDNDALSRPVAVEPGKHRVSAKRPGKEPWSSEITVLRAGLFVIVKVPRLEDANVSSAGAEAPAKPQTEPSVRRGPTPAPAPAPTPRTGARAAQRVALVLGGIGAGAALAGATFGLQYLSSNSDAKSVCPSSRECTPDEIAAHRGFVDDTKTKRTWAYVGLGVGGAALAGATIVYFTLGRHTSIEATPGANADGWNLAVRGRF